MSRELEGKVAIVTGAATGIGKAIAHAFGAAGANVGVNYLDTPELAEAVVAQISRDGGEALAVAADNSSRAQFEALVAEVNVKGTFHGCQLALERMAEGGTIVNISTAIVNLADADDPPKALAGAEHQARR